MKMVRIGAPLISCKVPPIRPGPNQGGKENFEGSEQGFRTLAQQRFMNPRIRIESQNHTAFGTTVVEHCVLPKHTLLNSPLLLALTEHAFHEVVVFAYGDPRDARAVD